LIASWIAGTFVSTAVLSIQAMRASASLFFQSIRLRKITANLFRYRKFPLIDTWGIIINNLSWQLPTLMLSSYFSQSIVGYYSLANRVLMLPMTIVGNAIAQVFYQRASETYSGKGSLANLTDIVFRRLSAISLYPALLLSVLGYDLFKLVFGAEWAEAGIYVQILGPWLFFLFISSPLSTLFSIMERQELAFLIHLLILVSRIISLIMGGSTGNIYLAIALWSGTGILVYGGMAIWILRLASVAWMTVLSGAWHYFRVSFLLIVPIAIMKFIPNMPGWVLIASGGLSGLLYVVWLLREEASQIENLIKLPKINPVDGDQTLSPMD
jgi:O-antigen/teichoic acid export membrane protein